MLRKVERIKVAVRLSVRASLTCNFVALSDVSLKTAPHVATRKYQRVSSWWHTLWLSFLDSSILEHGLYLVG